MKTVKTVTQTLPDQHSKIETCLVFQRGRHIAFSITNCRMYSTVQKLFVIFFHDWASKWVSPSSFAFTNSFLPHFGKNSWGRWFAPTEGVKRSGFQLLPKNGTTSSLKTWHTYPCPISPLAICKHQTWSLWSIPYSLNTVRLNPEWTTFNVGQYPPYELLTNVMNQRWIVWQ